MLNNYQFSSKFLGFQDFKFTYVQGNSWLHLFRSIAAKIWA